ncbi:DUF2750 domain-containing protein [Methylopila sp. M107]|uniref:DUF2750 domain-containing protein n=1 Tax=Methylopila sp. M107 TaxID=1101190 RepID=UPI0018CBB816|nr:DUF2750 domain-containing protein [Methylopila sp. M107]
MIVNQKQLEAVFALPERKKFEYFIKKVADQEQAWGLYCEGWAMAGTNDGRQVLLLWPAREFAEVCRSAQWERFEPRSISVYDLINNVIPVIKTEGNLIGVLYGPDGRGVIPAFSDFEAALDYELGKF